MTHNDARDIVIALFRTTWNDTTYPVAYDNASFTPPVALGAWARLIVQFFDGGQASIGSVLNRNFRYHGIVTVSVFTIMGDSTYNNDILCQTALDIFEGKSSSGVVFRDSEIVTVGEETIEERKWWQQNVSSIFIFDKMK